jgi:SAM-dependent methyltransferase
MRSSVEPRSGHHKVVEYYEQNTPFFLRTGEGGGQGHIHRGVWASGVLSLEQALNYVYFRVHERIQARLHHPVHVLDLGCGVGAGLRYFARRGVSITGITISPSQALRAQRLHAGNGFRGSDVICGDFSLANLPQSDLMYAVESLVHAQALEPLVENIAASLNIGGELVICDDFLSRPYGQYKTHERARIDCLKNGWQIPCLNTWECFRDVLHGHGMELTHSEDWTPYLRLNRWRDKMLAVVMRLGSELPVEGALWGSWKAGDALRETLERGLTQYRFGIWKKVR